MKRGMTIEYLKSRKDLNFDVDFRVNGIIGTIVTKWDAILLGLWFVFIHNIFFLFKNASYASNLQVVRYLLDDVKIYPDAI